MRTEKFQKFMNSMASFGHGLHSQNFRNEVGRIMASGRVSEFMNLHGKVQNEGSDCVDIMFHDAIGDWWSGSDSRTVTDIIRGAKGKKIRCDLNSFGGSAYDGIAIYNALVAHDSEVEMVISGIAYSAASIIVMAGDKIRIAANGTLGIHPASVLIYANQFDMDHYMKWLKGIDEGLIDTYAARSGKSRDIVKNWFIGSNNDGTMWTGKEAIENGLADELLPLKEGSSGSSSSGGGSGQSAYDSGNSPGPQNSGGNSGSRAPQSVQDRMAAIRQRQLADAMNARNARVAQILSHERA